MPIKIAVLKETRPNERRVAMVPDVVGRLTHLGASLSIQAGAGDAIMSPDDAFQAADVVADARQLVSDADIVLGVQPPAVDVVRAMRPGSILISFIHADQEPALVDALREQDITCFAMEKVPRITRAQAMDALSSQAALSGYYAALLGATHLGRIFPRMTTAVGSLRPAMVLVMGLGVAGLQAIATARRLGAVVEGYDVRPETKSEAASLGARFVDTGINGAGEGGYARELSKEERDRAAQILTAHIQQADVLITTASVPGRPAPRLVSQRQVDGMKRGAVIIDLAADGGGNCECSRPGETVRVGHVTVVAPLNVPSMLAEHASELYAKNVLNLLQLIIREQKVEPDWNDEVVAKTALTRAGQHVQAADSVAAVV